MNVSTTVGHLSRAPYVWQIHSGFDYDVKFVRARFSERLAGDDIDSEDDDDDDDVDVD